MHHYSYLLRARVKNGSADVASGLKLGLALGLGLGLGIGLGLVIRVRGGLN